MCKCTIEGHGLTAQLDFHPSQNFVGCIFTAILVAVPCFLDAFSKCMAGTTPPGAGDYKPGDRIRCQ